MRAIEEAVGPSIRAMQRLAPTLRAYREIAAPVNGVAFRYLRDFQDRIQATVRGMRARKEQFDAVMIALGWPPPGELPLTAERIIAEVVDRDGLEAARKLVDREVPKLYPRNILESMLSGWRARPMLQRRDAILTKAVKAHLAGDYELSIPVLLAQTEGIIADGFGHRGVMSGPTMRAYLDRLLESPDWWSNHQVVRAMFIRVILVGFEHGKPPGSDLSRHAILHGADTLYPTEANSLRAILMLDEVQKAFCLVAGPDGKLFHRFGCARTRSAGARLLRFRSVRLATERGLEPCPECDPVHFDGPD